MMEVVYMEERYLRHDLSERIVHWFMAISCILLILSGLNIRYPGIIPWGDMNTTRFVHFVSMYVLIFSFVFHVYHTLATEFRDEITGWEDIKKIPAVLKYYLFLSDVHPVYTKYNALQKLTYNILWVMILIQIVTGAVMYWPSTFMGLADALGGLMAVRILHNFMNYLFIAFLIIHIYMIVLEDIRGLWAMFHGYYYRRVGR